MMAHHRLSALALLTGLCWVSTVGAEESPFLAALSCRPIEGPGRVVCELTARATEGKLVWSDAIVVRAPAFAKPLRSRFVAQLGTAAAPGGAWAKLALVASEAGAGKLELLARGVICREGPAGEWCEPVRAPVSVDIRVAQPNSSLP